MTARVGKRGRVRILSAAVLLAGGIVLAADACSHRSDATGIEERALPEGEQGGLRVWLDDAAGELVLEMEPVDLPPFLDEHSHDHGAQPPAQYGAIPVSGWLHGYYVELVDGAGRPVPRELLHHVNIIAPDRRELFSPIMQRIGAAGRETSPVSLPLLLGYPVQRGDRILLGGMLHNPSERAYEAVRIRVRMPISSDERWIPPARVYPFYLDVMPPASVHRFDLPPGRSEQSWEGQPAVSGRILGMGGHLHRYAVALRLEDVATGELLWETQPILDDDGDVVAMPQERLWWRLGLRIREDRVYRLTAIYENPTSDTIPEGGMGALGGVLIPSRGRAWPTVDRDDPEYRLDVRLTESGGLLDDHVASGIQGVAGEVDGGHVHEAGAQSSHTH